ncbi:MAG: hypothetical protein A2X31_04295 [Elusimicrobia bacterium GWB2_63_22]|nr:MAG: hypothetical protein A2X31_04295 [Elusimicrobia bacterium GWB2_63_22]
MKSLTSVLGWTLLVAVMAVPSFLFYNWWAKSRQQASAEMPQEAPQNIFPPQEKSSTSAPVAAPVRQAQPAPAAQAVVTPAPQQPAQAPVRNTPAPLPEQAPSASSQPPVPVTAPGASAAVSTSAAQEVQQATAAVQAQGEAQQNLISYFKPKTTRDPTLSPDDYQRIKDAENARLEAERQARWAERNRPKAPDITSRLQLQGVVGNAAIINGEMYSVGQSVLGARLLKVGANYVIVEHKGKKFRKVLQ